MPLIAISMQWVATDLPLKHASLVKVAVSFWPCWLIEGNHPNALDKQVKRDIADNLQGGITRLKSFKIFVTATNKLFVIVNEANFRWSW